MAIFAAIYDPGSDTQLQERRGCEPRVAPARYLGSSGGGWRLLSSLLACREQPSGSSPSRERQATFGLSVCLFVLEIGSQVAQAGLELTMCLRMTLVSGPSASIPPVLGSQAYVP